ncbi:Uncharacterised protein [Mycobacteroides abscessus subsp. abscessus]|uniref:hypothetical protein n=1 Tax=Mycobacteroides abscessus TaxID=36809 RepID=UPI0009A6ED01|nr:hypothetical protein [Mycobacteroides abscessus]SKV12211.1 Uncharacterised protein [Mycobacteroides abscessus subsp. abscessus]
MHDTERVTEFLSAHPYARKTPEDVLPLMELADAIAGVPNGRIGKLVLFDVWRTCADRMNRDDTLTLANADVRDAAVRVANLPLDPVRGTGVLVGQDPRPVAEDAEKFGDRAVLRAYDPRHTRDWFRATRERGFYLTTAWVEAGVSLDDAWTVAHDLGTEWCTEGYRDRVQELLLSGRAPAGLVHGFVTSAEPLDDVLVALDTFADLNAEGGFPFALAAAGLGVAEDAVTDDDWNAFCDRKRVERAEGELSFVGGKWTVDP